jgi:ribosomal-protein-alanine N-acetyltransferase
MPQPAAGADRPTPSPAGERTAEATPGRADNPTDSPTDRATNRATDSPTDRATDRATDRTTDSPTDSPTDRTTANRADLPADGVVIAPMRRRHLRAVVAIERSINPRPWSLGLFAGELRMPTSRHWVVARSGVLVVGFAGLMVTLDEGHVTNFAVHDDFRRHHVATRMLLVLCREAIERGVCDMTLEVRASNRAALALYGRFGFAPGGVRKAYYQDNAEDALIMWAHDIGSAEGVARLARIEDSLAVQLKVED